MPRNPDHRGATYEEFERYERERPLVMRRAATTLQAWRYLCVLPECRRAQACVGPDGEHCAITFLRTALSAEERATFSEALRLRGQGADARTAWHEAERKIAQHQARMEAIGGMRGER